MSPAGLLLALAYLACGWCRVVGTIPSAAKSNAACRTPNTAGGRVEFVSGVVKMTAAAGEGMHRKVVIDTTVPAPPIGSDDVSTAKPPCFMVAFIRVPSGAYVDPDESARSPPPGTQQVLSLCGERVDIEAPEFRSTQCIVAALSLPLLNRTLGGWETRMVVPIHLRYHAPSAMVKHTSVSFSSPHVLTSCAGLLVGQRPRDAAPLFSPPDHWQSKFGRKLHGVRFTSVAVAQSAGDDKAVSFAMPVGQLNALPTVAACTLVTVAACVIGLLAVFFKA